MGNQLRSFVGATSRSGERCSPLRDGQRGGGAKPVPGPMRGCIVAGRETRPLRGERRDGGAKLIPVPYGAGTAERHLSLVTCHLSPVTCHLSRAGVGGTGNPSPTTLFHLKLYYWIKVFEFNTGIVNGKLPINTFLPGITIYVPGSELSIEFIQTGNSLA